MQNLKLPNIVIRFFCKCTCCRICSVSIFISLPVALNTNTAGKSRLEMPDLPCKRRRASSELLSRSDTPLSAGLGGKHAEGKQTQPQSERCTGHKWCHYSTINTHVKPLTPFIIVYIQGTNRNKVIRFICELYNVSTLHASELILCTLRFIDIKVNFCKLFRNPTDQY